MEETRRRLRGFQAQLSERLLTDLPPCPGARGQVDHFELSTPLSTAHFSNYAAGELYGLEHSPYRFAQRWLTPKTPIKGLHLTGQDILFCGVGSALMSGVLTAATLLGPNYCGWCPICWRALRRVWPARSSAWCRRHRRHRLAISQCPSANAVVRSPL